MTTSALPQFTTFSSFGNNEHPVIPLLLSRGINLLDPNVWVFFSNWYIKSDIINLDYPSVISIYLSILLKPIFIFESEFLF